METAATSSTRGFRASFGPGLMWAAAAIGVSHLVQSTRAGAMAGLAPAGIILLALILKYPFFEFGPRYAAATGTSLVEGYRRVGRWALWLYLGITLSTALIVQSAVVLFTSFLLRFVFDLSWSIPVIGGLVCAASAGLLLAGRFRALDITVKLIMVVLASSTLVAAFLALPRLDPETLTALPRIGGTDGLSLAFVLALVGWMPSAIDISVWSSLWTLEKDRTIGIRTSPAVVLADFRVGYVATGVLAFAFLVLGAALMHGSGVSFSGQGTRFSGQLVDLYTGTLGSWTRPVVVATVLTTMASTSLTVIDGFPRAISRSLRVLRGSQASSVVAEPGGGYWVTLAVLGFLTVVVFSLFLGSLTAMVDFATIVSFLTAPILGYLNLRAVRSEEVPAALRPGRGLVFVSYAGLAVLSGLALVYLGSRLA